MAKKEPKNVKKLISKQGVRKAEAIVPKTSKGKKEPTNVIKLIVDKLTGK
jgi:hypothetical protein